MKSNILIETLLFSTTCVLGPVLVLGGIGYLLDDYFGTDKVFLLSSVAVAFFVTQILMFKKLKQGYSKIASYVVKDDAEEDEMFEKKPQSGK